MASRAEPLIRGTRGLVVGDAFRFNVDGIMLSVHELKPGMAGRLIHPGVRLSMGLRAEGSRGSDEKRVTAC
jgi:hypothetical protein